MHNSIIVVLLIISLYARAAEQELLINGGFESGRNTGWAAYYDPPGAATSAEIVNLSYPYAGSWYAYLGDRTSTSASARGGLVQSIHVPPFTTRLTLRFHMSIASADSTTRAFDQLEAALLDPDGVEVESFGKWDNRDQNDSDDPKDYQAYRQRINNVDKYSGKDLILQFYASTDQGLYTTFRIDDVSLIADVPAPPKQYTISVISDANGSVEPSGVITAEEGTSLAITATPKTGYELKYWILDGQNVAAGQSQYTLSNIRDAHAIYAVFQPAEYILTVLPPVGGGSIDLDPPGGRYQPGTKVRLRVTPNQNSFFAGWLNDFEGLANPLLITMDKSVTCGAVCHLLPKDISLTKVIGAAPTLFTLPAVPGFDYLIRKSTDLFQWTATELLDGDQSHAINVAPSLPETTREFTEPILCQKTTFSRFLAFPLKDLTAKTARVTSLMDHHGLPETHDLVIETCTGFILAIDDTNGRAVVDKDLEVHITRSSYDRLVHSQIHLILPKGAPDLKLPFKYLDEALWYDGHAGYDFSVRDDHGEYIYSTVVAAAKGRLVPEASNTFYHEICLEHENGLRTYYFHLSRWEPEIDEAQRNNNQNYWVEAQTPIGEPGGWGKKGPNTFNRHLHFEVRRPDPLIVGGWRPVDPYGKTLLNGTQCEQELWLSRD